jgi:hypothetical protein
MEDYKADARGFSDDYSSSPRVRARKARMARAKAPVAKPASVKESSGNVLLSERHYNHFYECMTTPTKATEEMAEVARQIREFKKKLR